jgi:hypothetical protein
MAERNFSCTSHILPDCQRGNHGTEKTHAEAHNNAGFAAGTTGQYDCCMKESEDLLYVILVSPS